MRALVIVGHLGLVLPLGLVAFGLSPSSATAGEYHYLPAGAVGRATCAAAPLGWERVDFDDGAWPEALADSRALLAPIPNLASPASPASLDGGVPDAGHVAQGAADAGTAATCPVIHARRRFDVGAEQALLATLTLRLRYQDGFVAYLNGVEVARRRFVDGAALASEWHGGERESFTVRVVPGLLRPTGNVIAVEVHAARPTRRAIADVSLDGADGPHIVRGPYLQRVGTSDGWLVLDSDLPTDVDLEWRHGAHGQTHELHDGPGRHHVLHLTHLVPSSVFHYRVTARAVSPASAAATATGAIRALGTEGLVQSESDFHTPPSGGQPLRFAVYGDVRSGHDVHAQIVGAVTAEDPDLVLLTGDLVDRGGDDAEWERYFDVEAPLLSRVAVYPTVGNHEYQGHGLEHMLSLFLRPVLTAWWSFDVAGVHFVLLDSGAYGNPDQLAWLAADLGEARRTHARAIFVVAHDGPFSSALHGDNRLAVRDYAPLYERFHVSMVFSGHDHDYERLHVGSIDYVVSGGGGAELRTARCGVVGKRRCGPRTRVFANEHHYLMLEVQRDRFKLCPKRADGTLIEECPVFSLRR